MSWMLFSSAWISIRLGSHSKSSDHARGEHRKAFVESLKDAGARIGGGGHHALPRTSRLSSKPQSGMFMSFVVGGECRGHAQAHKINV